MDTLPDQVRVADPANVAGSCPGAILASPGGNMLGYAPGSTIPAASSCSISVDVRSDTPGSYLNTTPVGGLQTNAGDNPDPANAELTVVPVDEPSGVPSPPVPALVLLLSGLSLRRGWR